MAASFAPTVVMSAAGRASLYLAVDICLGIALASFYRVANIRFTGTLGVTLALAGLLMVRLAEALSLSFLYPPAALATAVGVLVLSTTLWRGRIIPGWVPAAFIGSIVLGSVGTLVAGAGVAVVASGVLFGVAFAALGYAMWP